MLEGSYEEPAYEPKIEVVSKIEELPTDMQIIIQLHFFEDKTLKEIAEITDTNLNTVKSRLYAACKKLGRFLEAEDEELVTRNKKAEEKQEKLKNGKTKVESFASTKQKREKKREEGQYES